MTLQFADFRPDHLSSRGERPTQPEVEAAHLEQANLSGTGRSSRRWKAQGGLAEARRRADRRDDPAARGRAEADRTRVSSLCAETRRRLSAGAGDHAQMPEGSPRELIRWTQTVTKHEALAIRRDRERCWETGRRESAKRKPATGWR